MKKIVVLLSLLFIGTFAKAEVVYEPIVWECSFGIGKSNFDMVTRNSKVFGNSLPTQASFAAYNCFNIYFAAGEETIYTGERVLDYYEIYATTKVQKIGLSLGKVRFNEHLSFSIAPYYYEVITGVYDRTHNRIGWENISFPTDLPYANGMGVSVHIDFMYEMLGIRLTSDFSTNETSFTIGVVLDLMNCLAPIIGSCPPMLYKF